MRKTFYFITISIFLAVCIAGCKPTEKFGPVELVIKNNALYPIKVVPQFNYPDTTLRVFDSSVSTVERGMYIDAQSESSLLNSSRWKRTIEEKNPSNILTLIVYSIDTLNQYSFEQIQQDYNILRRYELSVDELDNQSWTVVYP